MPAKTKACVIVGPGEKVYEETTRTCPSRSWRAMSRIVKNRTGNAPSYTRLVNYGYRCVKCDVIIKGEK